MANLITWTCAYGHRAVCSGGPIFEAAVLRFRPSLRFHGVKCVSKESVVGKVYRRVEIGGCVCVGVCRGSVPLGRDSKLDEWMNRRLATGDDRQPMDAPRNACAIVPRYMRHSAKIIACSTISSAAP